MSARNRYKRPIPDFIAADQRLLNEGAVRVPLTWEGVTIGYADVSQTGCEAFITDEDARARMQKEAAAANALGVSAGYHSATIVHMDAPRDRAWQQPPVTAPEPGFPGPRPGYEKADREIQDLLDRSKRRR